MTDSQRFLHWDQVDAARAEFDQLWDRELRSAFKMLEKYPELAAQAIAWMAFLHAKNLRLKLEIKNLP